MPAMTTERSCQTLNCNGHVCEACGMVVYARYLHGQFVSHNSCNNLARSYSEYDHTPCQSRTVRTCPSCRPDNWIMSDFEWYLIPGARIRAIHNDASCEICRNMTPQQAQHNQQLAEINVAADQAVHSSEMMFYEPQAFPMRALNTMPACPSEDACTCQACRY